jgi:hypothetical protein
MKQTLEQMAFPVYEGRERLSGQSPANADQESLAVVFLGSDIELEEAFKFLKRCKLSGRRMTFIFSEAAQRILSVPQLVKRLKPQRVITDQPYAELSSLVQGFGQVYVPNLTQNTAAKLAVGIQDDFVTNLLWKCLAINKPVYANSASVHHGWVESNLNALMASTMNGHLETLKGYGMKFEWPVFEGVVAESAVKTQTSKPIEGCVTLTDELANKVVTERHILSLEKGSRLALKKGVKITPLAREAAKKRKIELLQMEGGTNR